MMKMRHLLCLLLLATPVLGDTWTSTQAQVTDCSPWGDAGKTSTNSNGPTIFLVRNNFPDDDNDRRPLFAFDIDGDNPNEFPGASGDITAVSITFTVVLACSTGDDIEFRQVDPQCLHISPASDQASHFDEAEGDWLEKSAASGAEDWLEGDGGDVYGVDDFTDTCPTSTGDWVVNHANLVDIVQEAIANHDSWVFISLKWDLESSGGDDAVRMRANSHADYAEMTITYTSGIVIYRRRIEGHAKASEPVWADRPRRCDIRRAA